MVFSAIEERCSLAKTSVNNKKRGSHILGSKLGKIHRMWQVKEDPFQEDPVVESADLGGRPDNAALSSAFFPEQVVRFE